MAGNQPKLFSRRSFARHAALVSASAAFTSESSLFPSRALAAAPDQLPDNFPKLSPESQAEAEARFQLVLTRHGSRLTEEDKRNVRLLIYFSQPGLNHVRAFSLGNGDVPALFLKPIVERDKSPSANHPQNTPPLASKHS